MIFSLFFVLIVSKTAALVRVFCSKSTPQAVYDFLEDTRDSSQAFDIIAIHSEASLFLFSQDLALDYLYSESLSLVLETLTESTGRYRVMWDRKGRNSHMIEVYVEQFAAFAAELGLKEVLLLSNSQEDNLKATSFALEKHPGIFTKVAVLPTAADENFCNRYVGRIIKPRGVQCVALFTDETTTLGLFAAFERHKMNRPAYVFLLSQEASFFRYWGESEAVLRFFNVLVVAEEAAKASSYVDFQRAKLLREIEAVGSDELRSRSEAYDETTLFPLTATQRQTPSLDSTPPPAQNSLKPKSSKIAINVSVNYDITEPDSSTYPISPQLMRGFAIAFDEVNRRFDLIPDYRVQDNSVNFTGVSVDFNVTRDRVVKSIEKVGLIHMSPPFSQAILGLFSVFQSLNMTVPIAGASGGPSLSNSTRFPMYIRTRANGEYIMNLLCKTISNFGWKRLAVLYHGDSGDSEEIYRKFFRLATAHNITITNSEASRRMPEVVNRTSSLSIQAALQEIIDSDVRVLLITSVFFYAILDLMYDLGVREEYEILLTSGLTDAFYSEPQYFKRRVVSKGALMFYPTLFVRDEGEKVKKELIRLDNDSYVSNTCLYYDAAMLYFQATDYLLESGQDFEDPHMIMSAMRTTRFHGCSGLVQIESGSNDRSSGEISISNFRYDSEHDSYEIRVIGAYNPYIAEPFQFRKEDIQWANGETTFTDSKPSYLYCTFLRNKVSANFLGKSLETAICTSAAILCIAISVAFHRKVRPESWSLLSQQTRISKEDVLFMITVTAEFFSFACLGHRLNEAVASMRFLNVFRDTFLDHENASYWHTLRCALSLPTIWMACSALKALPERSKACFAMLTSLSDFLSPVMVKVLFVPLSTVLLQVVKCSKGLSDAEAFMDKDCNTVCWSGGHVAYAVVSCAILIAYTTCNIVHRLYWEGESHCLHIRANPRVAAIKVPLQVVLSASFVMLNDESPDMQVYVFIGLMSLYCICAAILEEYNYSRLNLWSLIMCLAAIVQSIVGFASEQLGDSVWASAGLAGMYALLVLSGVAIQTAVPKFASKLISERRFDIKYLLEFAFTNGKRAREALKNHVTRKSSLGDSDQAFTLYV